MDKPECNLESNGGISGATFCVMGNRKRHCNNKYQALLCGVLINLLLSIPIFLYGIIIECDGSFSPPLILNALYLMLHPIISTCDTFIQSFSARTILTVGITLTCFGIFFHGIVMQSTIVYGFFGALGNNLSSVALWMSLVDFFPAHDTRRIGMILASGQPLCLFIVPHFLSYFRELYGLRAGQLFMMVFVLNAIPLALLISQGPTGADPTDQYANSFHENCSDVPPCLESLNFQFNGDSQERTSKTWRSFSNALDEESDMVNDMKLITPDGVEILQVIVEEDAEDDEPSDCASIVAGESVVHAKSSSTMITSMTANMLSRVRAKCANGSRYVAEAFAKRHHVADNFNLQLWIPMKRSLVLWQFYLAVLQKSCEVFTFLVCITIIPCLANSHRNWQANDAPMLICTVAFPWLIAIASSIWTNSHAGVRLSSAHNRATEWYILGMALKLLGFILLYPIKTTLSVSCVFIGLGHGFTYPVQDFIIRQGFGEGEWLNVRGSIYLMSGLLIVVFTLITNIIFVFVDMRSTIIFIIFMYLLMLFLFLIKESKKGQ